MTVGIVVASDTQRTRVRLQSLGIKIGSLYCKLDGND